MKEWNTLRAYGILMYTEIWINLKRMLYLYYKGAALINGKILHREKMVEELGQHILTNSDWQKFDVDKNNTMDLPPKVSN